MYVAFYNGGLRVVDVSGELLGNLYRQGREIARFLPLDPEGFLPNAPQVWAPSPQGNHLLLGPELGPLGGKARRTAGGDHHRHPAVGPGPLRSASLWLASTAERRSKPDPSSARAAEAAGNAGLPARAAR